MLQRLLREPLKTRCFSCPSFADAQYALQGHVDRALVRDYEGFVLAIATDLVEASIDVERDAGDAACCFDS